ncbi:MarR family winged helix-turn-helix transcriptional regulator [Dinoroseobacter sp. S375]|uniref:MarR family winged helix-turn-helix transcriptional regulator n=1 Tax=Dinoroseobacter sp. S375 TaxID=3415136 RepID=UPI003C7BA414
MADTDLALSVDRFMRRIHSALQARAAEFDTENVGPAGGMLLLTLAEMGQPEIHELTARFARDKSQMTRVIGMLETKGLVTKRPSQRDQRASVVLLTPKGHRVVAELSTALAEAIETLVAPLNTDERQVLKTLMARIA